MTLCMPGDAPAYYKLDDGRHVLVDSPEGEEITRRWRDAMDDDPGNGVMISRLRQEAMESRHDARNARAHYAALRRLVVGLYDVIAHGDDAHRLWLQRKIADHFEGIPDGAA